MFSAGGKKIFVFNNKTHKIPAILYKLKKIFPKIVDEFEKVSHEDIKDYWDIQINTDNHIDLWFKLIKKESNWFFKDKELDVIKFIKE